MSVKRPFEYVDSKLIEITTPESAWSEIVRRMSATRKPKNPSLRRKLAKIASIQRKIDLQMGDAMKDLKKAVRTLDEIKPDYPK